MQSVKILQNTPFHAWLVACATALPMLYQQASARILSVGPGKTYATPSAARAVVMDGDTVEIEPGVYEGDVAVWNKNNLTLRATSKYAHLKAAGRAAAGKGIWVISGNNTLVENIQFSGAAVPDGNGSGIRIEGNGLIVRNCFFQGNENGILGGGDADSRIIIEYSEFDGNGSGDGYTHNIYISKGGHFTLRHSNSHHAKVGHNVKSRARENHILYNRILDGSDGTASYEIDLPNGGTSYIIGNIIQQGPASNNPVIVSYGAEGLTNGTSNLYVINNTIVNDRSVGTFVRIVSGADRAKIVNNLFVGSGTMVSVSSDTASNLQFTNPGLRNRAAYDYRLTAASPAIDKGINAGSIQGVSLVPAFEYLHNAGTVTRPVIGKIDIGAYEFESSSEIGRRGQLRKSTPGIAPGDKKASTWTFPLPPSAGPGKVNAAGSRLPDR